VDEFLAKLRKYRDAKEAFCACSDSVSSSHLHSPESEAIIRAFFLAESELLEIARRTNHPVAVEWSMAMRLAAENTALMKKWNWSAKVVDECATRMQKLEKAEAAMWELLDG